MFDLLSYPMFRAAVAGALAAAAIDFQAFRAWKSWDDFSTFDWKKALFRWAQGALIGAISAFGFTSI